MTLRVDGFGGSRIRRGKEGEKHNKTYDDEESDTSSAATATVNGDDVFEL